MTLFLNVLILSYAVWNKLFIVFKNVPNQTSEFSLRKRKSYLRINYKSINIDSRSSFINKLILVFVKIIMNTLILFIIIEYNGTI